LRPIIVQSKLLDFNNCLICGWSPLPGFQVRNHENAVKRSTATIENIAPPTERDLGGVIVYLVEVKFRIDEPDDENPKATQASLEELDKVWGVSNDSGDLWQQDWSKSVYPVENGVFVATLPADPGWQIGKRFPVLLPNVPE
jgi:hypothetical protein